MDGVIHETEGERVAWLVRPWNENIAGACVDSKVSLIFREEYSTLCGTKMAALVSKLIQAAIFHGILSKENVLNCEKARLVRNKVR